MPIKTKIISAFFRGSLRSQFLVGDLQEMKGKYSKQGKYDLCQPFVLTNAVEILDEDAINEIIKDSNKKILIEANFESSYSTESCVIQEKDSNVEYRKFGLFRIVYLDNLKGVVGDENSYDFYDSDTEPIDIINPFIVSNNALNGGRVLGDAILEFREMFEYEEKLQPPPEKITLVPSNIQCKAITKSGNQCKLEAGINSDFCHIHQPVDAPTEVESGGCFGDSKDGGLIGANSTLFRRFLQPVGLDRGGMNGCFSGEHSRPSGCFSPSLPLWRRGGCGCLSLLPFGIFLWFLYCMIFGDCSCQSQKSSEQNSKVTHDTIYLEVIKERTDTLKIVQMDTVKLVDSTSSKITQMVPLPNVQFKTNSDILLPSSARDLTKLAEHLEKNDSLKARILGHTDSIGSEAYNLELSQRRAEAVKNYLVSLGIDPSRIEAKGFGSSQKKADNTTLEGRLMNRRVEVILESTISTNRTVKPKPESTVPNIKDSVGIEIKSK